MPLPCPLARAPGGSRLHVSARNEGRQTSSFLAGCWRAGQSRLHRAAQGVHGERLAKEIRCPGLYGFLGNIDRAEGRDHDDPGIRVAPAHFAQHLEPPVTPASAGRGAPRPRLPRPRRTSPIPPARQPRSPRCARRAAAPAEASSGCYSLIDNQNARHSCRLSPFPRFLFARPMRLPPPAAISWHPVSATGSRKENVLPFPGPLWARISAPCAPTMACAMAIPGRPRRASPWAPGRSARRCAAGTRRDACPGVPHLEGDPRRAAS